jgi:pimeloyl-ACP methyl ester carboxylesterase
MSYTEDTITVRGKRIRLLRGGTGHPLLFLHDTFGIAWGALHDILATQYDVVFPVHPGCEGSEGFEAIDDMQDLVFHYLDLCDTLQIERPVLLGPSLGGWLAAEWAVRYADRLAGMILIDALGLRVPGAPAADILRLDAAQARAVLFADADAAVAQDLVPDAPDPERLPALLRARRFLARFAWQFADNPKLATYLYRVTTPTLVLWGERDAVVSTAHAHAYQEGIPDACLTVLPACGHLPYAERPEACARAILDFLSGLQG